MNRSRLLTELENLVGTVATMTMIHAHAGRRVYIPGIWTPDSWLSKLVGEAHAQALTDRYGGEHIHIPNNAQARAEARQEAVAQAIASGKPTREVARANGITPRHAQRLAKAAT